MAKNFTIPNPFAYFMQLSKAVKITFIVGLIIITLAFMYFTFEAGLWGNLLRWLFDEGTAKK